MMIESEQAFLLHSRKYTDSKVLVDFFSQTYGKVSGVMRVPSKKKQQGAPQPFTLLDVSWRGKSALKTVTSVELLSPPVKFFSNALYCAFYANELIEKLLPAEESYPQLYLSYVELLAAMGNSDHDMVYLETQLRRFELQLLRQLGYEIVFDHDSEGAIVSCSDAVEYMFKFGEGFIPRPFGSGGQRPKDILCRGETLMACAQGVSDRDDVRRLLKRVCRSCLSNLLDGRPLKSREFFL